MRQLEYANGASDFMRELKQSIVAEFVKYIKGYNGAENPANVSNLVYGCP